MMQMPFPTGLQRWKVTGTWTTPGADGSNTISYTFRTMAISGADCLGKAQAAWQQFQSINPISYNTPTVGW